ncbi:MAG: hypothetical protein JRG80_01225 [Deltaproteobacteria bacterium]|nr:hypothetical protein [Deltaproteobacteria bacterium]MBW2397875.1 hypothetical protein [Deltaproteobacteria bacterium]MBW2665148.1 hypothetical protein [Deltaproteobacteria bacterium]
MEFWSKGLGKRLIALTLTEGEALNSEGTLTLRGHMAEPVSWEYVMKLSDEDLVDFFLLLKDPVVADFIFESENRWKLYGGMLAGGLQLGVKIVTELLRNVLRRAQVDEDMAIQIPPPSERKLKKRKVKRRLSGKPSPTPKHEVVSSPEDLAAAIVAEGAR